MASHSLLGTSPEAGQALGTALGMALGTALGAALGMTLWAELGPALGTALVTRKPRESNPDDGARREGHPAA